MSNDPIRVSPELREVAEFVEYIEKTVKESEIGLSPESVRQIKSKYIELKMKAEIDIRTVPAFMREVSFRKMKELDALELRLETALRLGADKYRLHEIKVQCEGLRNSVKYYKALAITLASILAIILGIKIATL